MLENKVKVNGEFLTKRYEMAPTRADKVKALLLGKTYPNFWALRGIDFQAMAGESVAVIGTNGSGKSTLMNIISGATDATTGGFSVDGVVSLIAVQTGLKGDLSGRVNIRMKGLMMGMSEAEIDAKTDDIIAFSELGVFIDQPVKTYSSGMRSKLGFSISVHSNPDVLIVDEALSVGDATFTRKSLDKMKDFQKQGKTIFFVSHSLGQVREMADKVLWIERGEVKQFGPTADVLRAYGEFVDANKKMSNVERKLLQTTERYEQTNFTLDNLMTKEMLMNGAKTRAEKKEIEQRSKLINEPDGMSWQGWLGLGLGIGILVLMAFMLILQLSISDVLTNPSRLITDWGNIRTLSAR
ncbi:ABC transporter ATP-binding protein [Weissella tructae]|uniref:Teichoic acids export ATP-binding protein TagH n=2 Tax=Weissella TaxID=46255 RepID=A0A075TXJ8_9LACO|nr:MULTISPECIES: ABC transporter ATP-binding protein [Weissella]AIG65036.1 Teichoic acids export ATP-binding protein TagH [Weissella tructae]AIM62348.1 Teichoic acids export ATP-binding protein TagH [Weissella ceti]AIM63687.1 Teichoic acids export ATP-binding protein TagH [Weissella ceti]ELA07771.1 ABC transporter ATP-binding protein [Weissella ceti NC36]QVV91440.1 ABC transporter ATP-binding protein [Weissella tructae]